MSVHILMDTFTSPMSDSPIVDVLEPIAGQSVVNGGFIVRIPNYAAVDPPNPAILSNVLTAKHASILSFFSAYANMRYDDMLDTSGIDLTATTDGIYGTRGCIGLPAGATLQSQPVSLGSTPATVVLTWEIFTYIDSDSGTGRFTRTYNELPTTSPNSTATVSTNNGGAYTAALDRISTAISGPNQGSTAIVRITNTSGSRLYVGGWSLLY